MPIVIDAHKEASLAQKLPFCYLCGAPFSPTDETNKDHVPPSTLFLPADRDFPLILTTHRACNQAQSSDDQTIGTLIGFLHAKHPSHKSKKLKLWTGPLPSGAPGAAVGGFDLRRIIRRWVRGFHAALYREPLLESKSFMTFPPFPVAQEVNGLLTLEPIPVIVPHLVDLLKRNKATGALDKIVCRQGKCQYECVWSQADDGTWFCVYGLKLYDWSRLGDTTSFERRGCVGLYYRPDGGLPGDACTTTTLEFNLLGKPGLDPFEGDQPGTS